MKWSVLVCAVGGLAAVRLAAQTPDVDVYVARLSMENGRVAIGEVRNVTRRAGYDNQPHFTADGRSILYTAIDSAGRADIWRYDIAADRTVQVTRTTPESEYSPTPLRGGGFSVVRVERDSTQRLWRFDDDGGNARVLLGQVRPVGYHAWVDDDVVALFVLGTPATLQVANIRSGEVKTHASSIGRSLQRIPGRRAISFVQQAQPGDTTRTTFRELDAASGAIRTIAPVPILVEDGRRTTADFHAWTPGGVLVTTVGSHILAWDVAAGSWYDVANLEGQRLIATRLAISPSGDRIAIVGQTAPR